MKKKLLSILLTGMLAFSLVACGSDDDEDTSDGGSTEESSEEDSEEDTDDEDEDTGEAKDYTIGVSLYDLSNEYFQYMLEGLEEQAEATGVVIDTHDQKNDENELVTGCTNLIDKGVDALVVSPCKPEVMGNIVDLAHEADIPVIILDIGDGGSDKDVIVVSDMYGGGEKAGEYALDLLEEDGVTDGEYAIIKCEESAEYAIQRGQGFDSVLEAAGFDKVAEITANSQTTEGYSAMQDILASNPDVKVVFAENDNMALGAASAIDEAGKAGEILVFGFDGNESAIDAIEDGTMAGTIAQQPVEIGKLGIDLAIEKIEGNELSYDDADTKEIYADVYLIDNTGERNDNY